MGDQITVTIKDKIKQIELPEFGEVKIIISNGEIKFVETLVKEKMD